MPPEEQAKLHSRMTEWAALSAQQRTQARLNFAETKQLSADEKKSQVGGLPGPERRRKAASWPPRRRARSAGAAPAVRPVPRQKLAALRRQPNPAPNPDPGAAQSGNATPELRQVDRSTLPPGAPQEAPAPEPAPAHRHRPGSLVRACRHHCI